jgi:hypothetical protein
VESGSLQPKTRAPPPPRCSLPWRAGAHSSKRPCKIRQPRTDPHVAMSGWTKSRDLQRSTKVLPIHISLTDIAIIYHHQIRDSTTIYIDMSCKPATSVSWPAHWFSKSSGQSNLPRFSPPTFCHDTIRLTSKKHTSIPRRASFDRQRNLGFWLKI